MLRAGPRAIAFAELHFAAEHAAGAVVRHDVHDAGGRRLDLRARPGRCCARSRSNFALSRLRCLATMSASAPVLSDLAFCLGLAQLLLGVRHGQLRLFVLQLRHEVALAEIELRAIEVVPRLHHRRLVLLLRDPLLRLHLRDLGVAPASTRRASPASAASAWSRRTRRARRPPSRRVPFFASLTIWSSPACVGAASTIDFAGRMSPRSCR